MICSCDIAFTGSFMYDKHLSALHCWFGRGTQYSIPTWMLWALAEPKRGVIQHIAQLASEAGMYACTCTPPCVVSSSIIGTCMYWGGSWQRRPKMLNWKSSAVSEIYFTHEVVVSGLICFWKKESWLLTSKAKLRF